MKLNPDFVLRTVAGESMLVAVGKSAAEYNGIIVLTDTGASLWSAISEGKSEQELWKTLVELYSIDEATAKSDTAVFIKKMKDSGLII